MQKQNFKQEFNCSLETLLQARQERYKHLDKFPELKNVTIVSEERNGDVLKQVRRISVAASLPPIITSILPPGSDSLLEESEFHDETNTHDFKISPGGLALFMIKGQSKYVSVDETHAARSYDIEITSDVPFIGAVVEAAITDMYRGSLEKDRDSILGFIKLLETESL